jgi:hypothetical protein
MHAEVYNCARSKVKTDIALQKVREGITFLQQLGEPRTYMLDIQ